MSYHTFAIAGPSGEAKEFKEPGHRRRPVATRRGSTSFACIECRRRKIRCEGTKPCQQCLWYGLPEQCEFPKLVRRLTPSRTTIDNLEARIELLTSLVSKLFPERDAEQLASLSRDELIRLLLTSDDAHVSPVSHSTPADAVAPTASKSTTFSATAVSPSAHTGPQSSTGAEDLSTLEQAPERDPVADEAQRYGRQMQSLSDDVNALSLSVRRKASYVGVSSISAALEVIFKVEPFSRAYIQQDHTETANPSRRNSQDDSPLLFDTDLTSLPPPDVAERHIETYFTRVHPLMPMIDEQEFRHMYLYTNRKDTPWLMLLNMVLALGALANPTAGADEHLLFSYRVRSQFSLELFGSGNLFVLQALGLLTGYYLHWLSRPNEANALMGAALRMAIALGLHREFSSTPKSELAEIPVETRRRTWWTLVCLDTWAAMTTGRPSMGRNGVAITVEQPRIPERTNNAQYLASLKLLPLVHNASFSRIATSIQDRLATVTILSAAELSILDAELVQWHDDLPPIIKHEPSVIPDSSEVPEALRMPRLVLYWWYMTLRVLAHRPLLLSIALRRIPFDSLSGEEQTIVAKCQKLAGDTIEDIGRSCGEELIQRWTAVWLMYQVVMVPLVSIFLHTSIQHKTGMPAASRDQVESWRRQIRIAISFYGQKDVNISKKCEVMLQKLYDANSAVEHATLSMLSGQYPAEAQWDQQMPNTSSAFVSSEDDSMYGFESGVGLDQWLQTYEEPVDAPTAWDDMIWAYNGGNVLFSSFQPSANYSEV